MGLPTKIPPYTTDIMQVKISGFTNFISKVSMVKLELIQIPIFLTACVVGFIFEFPITRLSMLIDLSLGGGGCRPVLETLILLMMKNSSKFVICRPCL